MAGAGAMGGEMGGEIGRGKTSILFSGGLLGQPAKIQGSVPWTSSGP